MTSNRQIEELVKECLSRTVAELDFIVRNNYSHSQEQVIAAKQVIERKRAEWKIKNVETSRQIDDIIRKGKETWFDFHVLNFDGYRLAVAGSIDLAYYHTLEIIFEDVFFVSCFFRGWRSDTEKTVFQIPNNEIELNRKYEIEQDYQFFIFRTEDYKNDVIIAANNVTFNTDTVFYYDRPDLKQNERIADFVKKKNAL